MAQGIKSNISKEVLENLLETNTLPEIAEILGVSLTTVKRYKAKYGLSVNKEIALQRNIEKHTVYECNINYFNSIDTMNKAYILGFLCADGFVTERNEIGIGLQIGDKDMIEFFQKELKSNKPIKEKDNSCEIRIQNKNLCDNLKKYGVVPNKSLILDIEEVISKANLSEDQIKAFLLGYYDGDGGIYYYSPNEDLKEQKGYVDQWSMSVTGTKETCNYYQKYFNVGFITKRHEDDKNNYTWGVGGCNQVEKVLSKLYSIKSDIAFCYNRKFIKYIQVVEHNNRK